MNHTQHPSIIAYNKLISAPDTTSVFSTAFNAMLTGNRLLAEDIFDENVSAYKPSVEYRYMIAKFTGPWWTPFNCALRHGKLGTLACRGNEKAIAKLYEKGEVTGIQIAHALIECSLDPKPNPTFTFSASEKVALLQTYALEAEVFCKSGQGFYPSLAWLNNRTRRAVRFFNLHAKACQGNHSPLEEAVVVPDSTQVSPVKWPDRLYDLEGVSSPLIYTGN